MLLRCDPTSFYHEIGEVSSSSNSKEVILWYTFLEEVVY